MDYVKANKALKEFSQLNHQLNRSKLLHDIYSAEWINKADDDLKQFVYNRLFKEYKFGIFTEGKFCYFDEFKEQYVTIKNNNHVYCLLRKDAKVYCAKKGYDFRDKGFKEFVDTILELSIKVLAEEPKGTKCAIIDGDVVRLG